MVPCHCREMQKSVGVPMIIFSKCLFRIHSWQSAGAELHVVPQNVMQGLGGTQPKCLAI